MSAVLPYDEEGSGETVLLLHAGICDRSMWREHLGWLAGSGFRGLAVDFPGFGDAAVGVGAQAPWEDVLATLKELDVDRAAIVGNSFGAAVAERVAVIARAAVTRLMLISPPPLGLDPSPALSEAWEAEEAALERGDVEGAVSAVLAAWLQPDASPELRDRLAGMQRRAFELQMQAEEVEEAPDPLEGRPEELARLRMPVLATAGEADMPDFKAGAAEIAELVPNGRSVEIQGAGHLAPLEQPAEFRRLLLDFLRGADRS